MAEEKKSKVDEIIDNAAKKQDDSNWEIVDVSTQTAPAIHNKVTDEIITEQKALIRVLEGIDYIKRRVG